MDYLLCIEEQTVCQLLLKLLISLTQTHNHRTMYDCVGDWQEDLDYISFMST